MTSSLPAVLWSLGDWADAVVGLPMEEPWPRRAVIVPNERVAHALRRTLLERGERASLVGTRFVRLAQLAADILRSEGEPLIPTDREVARLLTRASIGASTFEYFDPDQLLSTPGWDEAITRTLSDLQAAEVEPGALLGSEDRRIRDVGRIFASIASHGQFFSPAMILRRATRFLPAVDLGPTLATITGFESAAEARFLNALPRVQFARWGVRPCRPQHEERVALLFGPSLREDATSIARARGGRTRLEALQAVLLTAQHADVQDDETVRIVTYAGVHEEVEAAVAWVVAQIMSGCDARDIAIVAPNIEAYGPLLRARLGSLPWPGDGEVVFSECGVPAVERADGRRILLVLRALGDGLSRDALAPLLAILRPRDPDVLGLKGLSRAWTLLNAVAHGGGERSHVEGGLRWSQAWARAIARLVQPPVNAGGLDERDAAHREALGQELERLLPAITALEQVLRQIVSGASLDVVQASLLDFVQTHLKLPPATPPAWTVLAAASEPFCAGLPAPAGLDALAWLERMLREAAYSDGRFGAPRVYVGTLAGVRGLSFRAVRVLGLVEGAVPSAVREDAVLPDAARQMLSVALLTSRQRAHRQVAAFDDAVRSARERLVLSAPRVSAERSSRQPAAVLLDVVRALRSAEPHQRLERALEETASKGRSAERALHESLPLSASTQLDRIARGDRTLRASEPSAMALACVRAIGERAHIGAQDGLLANVFKPESLPGLTPERPISASRLETLLSCPHRYLYEHMLGFREPDGPLPTDVLPANLFGTWLHGIAETFWRAHGQEIAARDGDLTLHRAALRALATSRFQELRDAYPFANEMVAGAERDALCDQLDKLLLHDWNDGTSRTFVDVERAFGFAEPCVITTAAGPLFVRGKIDKLDTEGDALLVRDIKTGAGKPRRADDPPDVGIDLQLGLYAQVAEALARTWGTPRKVGVSYLYLRRGELERSWRGEDQRALDGATKEWLATAREILTHGAFVRTLNRDDCRFCPHQPVCAAELERAAVALDDPRVPRRLVQLKGGGAP